jgi:AraC-like DNA-binding protein
LGLVHVAKKIVWEAGRAVRPRITTNGILERLLEAGFPLEVRFIRRREPCSPPHRHDYFELCYLQSGEVLYQVNERLVHVREGDLFVLNGALRHRMRKSLRPGLREIVLYFLPELIREDHAAGDDWQYLTPFTLQGEDFPHVVPARTGIPAEVSELIRRIHRELPAQTSRARLTAKTCLKMILVLLVNHYASFAESSRAAQSRERDLQRLKPLFDYVARCYRDPITVSDGAAILYMSRPHFMRLFRSTMGETFVTYLNRFRIAKAEVLLATTNKTIAEVGLEAGFKDQSYFGQVFRKLLHATPRAYRGNLRHRNGTSH